MTAQPIHPHEPERVARNAEGIAAALSGERRMEFYRELLAAAPEEAEGVLRRWWCEAMLDTDPVGDRLTASALDGTLPTTAVADLVARRREAGLPVE
ncbi:hypothetical protein [Streptomyces ureilyticus]|uniref:Uncharacterized protein n=1 Tax=Streptomyces ureilyticus TaxID=1775131 RepID=A0ABX0E354_9ACTN|nr:hypothetical protein [Streptomyces ureilyticus]NGO48640.1 hypothetical protein [Streptomyces ureilyticus]